MNSLRLPLFLLFVIAMAGVGHDQASAQQPFIDKVPGFKADSLMLFGFYFKWPPGGVAGNEFVIGVLGKAQFTKGRVTQKSATVGRKKIRVLLFDSAKDYSPCHILFVANDATANSLEKTPQSRLAAAIKKVDGTPVLIVAEDPGAAERGAMANFVFDEAQNRLHVEVNEAAVKNGKIGFTRNYLSFRQTKQCVLVK